MNDQVARSATRDILFRLYGVAFIFFSLKTYVSAYQVAPETLLSSGSCALHSLTLTALFMIGRGASPLSLCLAFTLAARCMISTHRVSEPLLWFPAAEWPIFMMLPLFTLLGLLISRLRSLGIATGVAPLNAEESSDVDQFTLMTFRLSFLGAMGWAALHKLNGDFFDMRVSCARLSTRLTEWWGVPEALYAQVTPHLIVTAELSLGLILWWRPRLGVALGILILGHFGTIGATALASLVIVMALAFLTPRELTLVVSTPRRRPALSLAICGGAIGISYWAYQGPWSWAQYGLFHGFISLALLGLINVCWAERSEELRPHTGHRPFAYRGFALLMILAWGVNGITPYLGLKFHYSFAMLSNLRVDDNRWNSYLFPRGVRWSRYDGMIHVSEVTYRSASTGRLLRGGPLQPGVYSPTLLRAYLKSAQRAGERIQAQLSYRGETRLTISQPPQALEAWLKTVSAPTLVQKKLTLSQPQRCIH